MENEFTKIVVIIEGIVSEDNWGTLRELHQGSTFLPEGLVSSVLVQSKDNPFMWKIINMWDGLASLGKDQTASGKPSAAYLLEAVNAKARAISSFEVRSDIGPNTEEKKA